MSLLDSIKKDIKKSGSSKGKVFYIKDGSKARIRFLQDVEDGIPIKTHDSYAKGVNVICQKLVGKKCNYCKDETLRHRTAYAYSVWDHDAKEVKIFMGFSNAFSPLPALISMYESYGNLTDRDYVISRTGTQMNTSYGVVPMDKAKFKNTKAKPYSKKKLVDILNKAFPVNEDDDDDEDQDYEDNEDDNEDDDEDAEENEYDEMSPKELYIECVERGLKVKKKQKPKYYIDKLVEDDEKAEDGWDDEEDEDEEDEW